jgi:flagellar hook-associated protein 2
MATISSVGIGSGLDVKSIVSQLVALEKQPLTQLKSKADNVQAQVSAYGQIKSLVSTLSDAVGALASLTGWNGVTASSSDSSSVSVSAIGGTSPTVFSVGVTTLAKAKATTSAAVTPSGSPVGQGTLNLSLASGSSVNVEVSAEDTVASIASKINGAGAGVTATVLTDAAGDRLMLRSADTGVEAAFTLSVTADADGNLSDAAGLSRLVEGSTTTQSATDAVATVNGVTVTSPSNTFANTVAGVTFTALKVTSTPAEINIARDLSSVKTGIDAFVKAYNEINKAITDATKYDASTKTAGVLQGDATALGLQSALRGLLQSGTAGGAFSRLSDVGITQQLGGALAINSAKLDAALLKPDDLKNLFRADSGNTLTDGIATKLQTFSAGLMTATGLFSTKEASLQKALDRNSADQTKVNDRAARVEVQLNKRYSALDAQMASLTALNAYISQQVATWNKSTA